MASKRMIVTISEDDKKWLDGYSKAKDISVAEAIRQGIGLLKEVEGDITYKALVKKTSGIWQQGNGLGYQERSRASWNKQ